MRVPALITVFALTATGLLAGCGSDSGGSGAATTQPATETSEDETFQEATRRFQAELLRQALEANGWSVIETARRLDVARSHVYKLIGAFGLERGRK